MKKLVLTSLLIFWAAVVTILTAGLVFYQKQQAVSSQSNNLVAQNSNNQKTNLNTSTGNFVLTAEEVVRHNSVSDCWMIIQNKVYNVTSYVNLHPGNSETITPYCGKEATTAFETKDKNKPHSQEAWNLLNDYYVGDLNQQLTSQNLQENLQKTQGSGMDLLTKKILDEFPGGEISKVKPKKDGGYDVDLIYNGINYKIKTDSEGNILKKEIKKGEDN